MPRGRFIFPFSRRGNPAGFVQNRTFPPGTEFQLGRHRVRVVSGECINMPGRDYLIRQATTLLRFARQTRDPGTVAGLLDKATSLTERLDEHLASDLDLSPRAPRRSVGKFKLRH